jgi:hypothetical protein
MVKGNTRVGIIWKVIHYLLHIYLFNITYNFWKNQCSKTIFNIWSARFNYQWLHPRILFHILATAQDSQSITSTSQIRFKYEQRKFRGGASLVSRLHQIQTDSQIMPLNSLELFKECSSHVSKTDTNIFQDRPNKTYEWIQHAIRVWTPRSSSNGLHKIFYCSTCELSIKYKTQSNSQTPKHSAEYLRKQK